MADLLIYTVAVLAAAAILAWRLKTERRTWTTTVEFTIDTTRIDLAFAALGPHSSSCTSTMRAEGSYAPDCRKCEASIELEHLRVTQPTTADLIEAREAPLVRAVRERHAQYASMAEFEEAWETTREHLAAVRLGGFHFTRPQVWIVGVDPEPFDPVDLTPYIAHATWDAAAFDTHPTTPPPGDIAYGEIPEGCWRTVLNHGDYQPCNAPTDDDLGLCPTHRQQLTQEADA